MDLRIDELKLDKWVIEWAGTPACRVTRGLDLQPRLQALQDVIKKLRALDREPTLLELGHFRAEAQAADSAAYQAHSEARSRNLSSVRLDEWKWHAIWEFIEPARELAQTLWYDAQVAPPTRDPAGCPRPAVGSRDGQTKPQGGDQ